MRLLWALRIALYIQLVMGLARFFGLLQDQRIWELHIGLGLAIVVLALIALRPLPGVQDNGIRDAARFLPLLTLVLGLLLWFNLAEGLVVRLVHVILGLSTVGAVEVSAARQRRAMRT